MESVKPEKLKSWDELKEYRTRVSGRTSMLAENDERVILAVGEATCGIAAGAKKVAAALQDEIGKQGLRNISIIATGCLGYCYAEPTVEVRMPGKPSVYYGYVNEETARNIVSGHLAKGQPIENNILPVEVVAP